MITWGEHVQVLGLQGAGGIERGAHAAAAPLRALPHRQAGGRGARRAPGELPCCPA